MMNRETYRRMPHHSSTILGAIGTLSLNAQEMKCLEIALYFLTEQLNQNPPPVCFLQLRNHHVQHLSQWLDDANLKMKRRSVVEGAPCIEQSISSFEDAEWLALAVQIGITWETIAAMATDAANYERDMKKMAAKTAYNSAGIEAEFHRHVCDFHAQYSQATACKNELLAKLRQILNA